MELNTQGYNGKEAIYFKDREYLHPLQQFYIQSIFFITIAKEFAYTDNVAITHFTKNRNKAIKIEEASSEDTAILSTNFQKWKLKLSTTSTTKTKSTFTHFNRFNNK